MRGGRVQERIEGCKRWYLFYKEKANRCFLSRVMKSPSQFPSRMLVTALEGVTKGGSSVVALVAPRSGIQAEGLEAVDRCTLRTNPAKCDSLGRDHRNRI